MKEKPEERTPDKPKKRKMTAAGRLYYTFGTILLLSVITVCSINFSKDGRAFQIPKLTASVEKAAAGTTPGSIANSDGFKTIKYNKTEPKQASKPTSGKSSKASAKPAATPAPTPKPAVDP